MTCISFLSVFCSETVMVTSVSECRKNIKSSSICGTYQIFKIDWVASKPVYQKVGSTGNFDQYSVIYRVTENKPDRQKWKYILHRICIQSKNFFQKMLIWTAARNSKKIFKVKRSQRHLLTFIENNLLGSPNFGWFCIMVL